MAESTKAQGSTDTQVGPLKARAQALREALAARYEGGDQGLSLGVANAAGLSEILCDLFAQSAASQPAAAGVSLGAVGSLGRGMVALRSDVDVRFVVSSSRDMDAASALGEAMLYPLWDAGVSVGHQVISADELLTLAQTDLASATTLLDYRHLAGAAEVAEALGKRAFAGLFSEGELGQFVRRLEEEGQARHERFGGSVYLLEPDVKSGAGGLRDLDAARWAAQARYGVRVGPDGGGVFRELVRLGVLVTREADQIAVAEDFMWRLRNGLHLAAGRRADRLTFESQEALGVVLGYGSGDDPDARAVAAERLMQDYYRHARVILRAREQLLALAAPPRRRGRPVELDLSPGLSLFDGQVNVSAQDLADDPALALRAYRACVQQGASLLPFARETIARAAGDAAWAQALRACPDAGPLFVSLVCTVADTRLKSGSVLRELHDTGLLLCMVPEFTPVTGRVHHDVYHVYTVDVHSVAAVDRLRALCRGELLHEHALASRLAAEIARPVPLFLATLLHDVGKGYPDADGSRRNHSKVGAEFCQAILPRLGLSPDDVAEASDLVLQHLAMYHTATRRDLDDPQTSSDFSGLVRGREGLRNLYLLTVVDLATTSPTALSSWKARMLDELYLSCDAFLGDAGHQAQRRDSRRVRAFSEARGLWNGPQETLDAFLSSMPERYTLAASAEAVCAHARVAQARGDEAVHVDQVPSRHPGIAELCVTALDRPGLLASIAAVITAHRLEVLAAEVYSRAAPSGTEAVDLFWVKARGASQELSPGVVLAMKRDLLGILAGDMSSEELLESRLGRASQWRERPSPRVRTEVSVDDRASPTHTVIEVFAKDRPGLLFSLARAFRELGLQIALSKINTEGNKVADVFYVTELDGTKVAAGDRSKYVRQSLLSCLELEDLSADAKPSSRGTRAAPGAQGTPEV